MIAYVGTAKSVVAPSSVSVIASDAFSWNMHVEEIVLSDGITTIEYDAFTYNPRLKTVVIPKSVLVIENYAFESCQQIQTIVYEGSKEDWEKVSVGENNQTLISKLTFAE